jgi:hypothetical protein
VRNVSEAAELAAEAGRDSTIPVRIEGLPDRDDVQIMGRGFTAASIPPTSLDAPPRLDANRDEILCWLERRREADAA